MRIRHCLFSLSVLTVAVPLTSVPPAAAADVHDCSGLSNDAVKTVPMPLAKWAQVACTPIGEVMMSKDDWIWIMPDASGMVFIPSQIVDGDPKELGNGSYFTKIDVQKVNGEEFDRAYDTFHIGFDDKEVKPDGYRVDLQSVSGQTMRVFFFDYDTYAWGMTCEGDKCDPQTRFMVLDKNHRPEPRQPAI
jgi:hypothetical protein